MHAISAPQQAAYGTVSYTQLRAHETIALIAYAVFCLKFIYGMGIGGFPVVKTTLAMLACDIHGWIKLDGIC